MGNSGNGLPDKLKAGIEALSGMNLEDIRVHYDTREPAQLGAQAHAQGTDIHLAPGQQHQLAHEAWHVVQQAQGRVSPSGRSHIGLNADPTAQKLERELLARRTPL